MDNSAPTIIDLKADFLRKQIHILSEPIRPTADFYTSTSFVKSSLEKKTIDKILHQLNKRLKRHNNLVYGRRAQRHVAEQVDRLYWDIASPNQSRNGVREAWAEIGTDYCDPEIIEKLPDEWPVDIDKNLIEEKEHEQETRRNEEDGVDPELDIIDEHKLLYQRYADLSHNLTELNTRRHVIKQRVEKLNSIQDILKFFDCPMEIQKNLVTRGGELEQELERMCRLMLRVERGLGTTGQPIHSRIETSTEHNDQVDFNEFEELKVLKLIT